jgi:molybdopterin/thiamine biosynthesis adenylyltransferase/rhodanese-related sulfurtransferase
MDHLSNDEIRRYSRHLLMPEVSAEGQKKLKKSKVLIIGLGGLGSPAAYYLASAGVGRLGLADFDRVELSNLQRQILYNTEDVGKSKVEVAGKKIYSINPHIDIHTHDVRLTAKNAFDVMKDYDFVIDGTDNFSTRYLINDACVLLSKPYVYGSVYRFEGKVSVFAFKNEPCYRCLYPEPPLPGSVPGCAEGGVLGVLPGIIGSVQAIEVIKLILGKGDTLSGRLLLFDGLNLKFTELALQKNHQCAICGTEPTITELMDYREFCGEVDEDERWEISPVDLKKLKDKGERIVLLDVRNPEEVEISNIKNSTLIPLPDLPGRLDQLNKNDMIIVYCRIGERSRNALEILKNAGFKNVKNLTGGINAWAEQVDQSLLKY